MELPLFRQKTLQALRQAALIHWIVLHRPPAHHGQDPTGTEAGGELVLYRGSPTSHRPHPAAHLLHHRVLQQLQRGSAPRDAGEVEFPVVPEEGERVAEYRQEVVPLAGTAALLLLRHLKFLLELSDGIAQEGILILKVGVKGRAVDHGPLTDIHHRQLLERPLLHQRQQRVHQKLFGPPLPQVLPLRRPLPFPFHTPAPLPRLIRA